MAEQPPPGAPTPPLSLRPLHSPPASLRAAPNHTPLSNAPHLNSYYHQSHQWVVIHDRAAATKCPPLVPLPPLTHHPLLICPIHLLTHSLRSPSHAKHPQLHQRILIGDRAAATRRHRTATPSLLSPSTHHPFPSSPNHISIHPPSRTNGY